MKSYYEVVVRCMKTKFEDHEEAIKHAKALEKLGYSVAVKYVVITLYCEAKTLIYKTWEADNGTAI